LGGNGKSPKKRTLAEGRACSKLWDQRKVRVKGTKEKKKMEGNAGRQGARRGGNQKKTQQSRRPDDQEKTMTEKRHDAGETWYEGGQTRVKKNVGQRNPGCQRASVECMTCSVITSRKRKQGRPQLPGQKGLGGRCPSQGVRRGKKNANNHGKFKTSKRGEKRGGHNGETF